MRNGSSLNEALELPIWMPDIWRKSAAGRHADALKDNHHSYQSEVLKAIGAVQQTIANVLRR